MVGIVPKPSFDKQKILSHCKISLAQGKGNILHKGGFPEIQGNYLISEMSR